MTFNSSEVSDSSYTGQKVQIAQRPENTSLHSLPQVPPPPPTFNVVNLHLHILYTLITYCNQTVLGNFKLFTLNNNFVFSNLIN